MSELFIPEDIEEKNLKDILTTKKNTYVDYETNFVFACGKELYMLPIVPEYEQGLGKPIKLLERGSPIIDICSHNSVLYDLTSKGEVRETNTGGFIIGVPDAISLCSHKSDFYVAEKTGKVFPISMLSENAKDEDVKTEISDLISFEDNLYASTKSGMIWNVKTPGIKIKMDREILKMCTHKDELYFIYNELQFNICRVRMVNLGSDFQLLRHEEIPVGLCSYNKEKENSLYFALGNKIHSILWAGVGVRYNFENGTYTDEMPGKITALTAVPNFMIKQK